MTADTSSTSSTTSRGPNQRRRGILLTALSAAVVAVLRLVPGRGGGRGVARRDSDRPRWIGHR